MFMDSVVFSIFITELGQSCQAGHICRWCEAGHWIFLHNIQNEGGSKSHQGFQVTGHKQEEEHANRHQGNATSETQSVGNSMGKQIYFKDKQEEE